MHFDCACGNRISDTSDGLRHKAHLTPDQDLYDVWDGMDVEVIDRVASGELSQEEAYVKSRRLMSEPTRTIYQCFECGRIYIHGLDEKLHSFRPETDVTDSGILRSRKSK